MSIILRLDRVMADRKMSLKELAERVEISNVNLSNLKTGKVRAIRFSTLDAICRELHCQPGDILEYVGDDERRGRKEIKEDVNGAETLFTSFLCSQVIRRQCFARQIRNHYASSIMHHPADPDKFGSGKFGLTLL